MKEQQSETPINTKEAPTVSVSSSPIIKLLGIAIYLFSIIAAYSAGFSSAKKQAVILKDSTSAGSALSVSLTPTVVKQPDENRKLSCTEKECLLSDTEGVYGYTQLHGYFATYDGSPWEWNNSPITCNSIIATDKNSRLIDDFYALIQQGNTLNKIIDNFLHINIDISDLPAGDKNILLQSSESNQVTLDIIRPIPPGRGASTCTSYIRIIRVSSGT